MLLGCGGGGTPPVTRDRMLVLSSSGGPVMARLRQEFGEVPYTGSEDPSRYEFIVVDGAHTSADQLGSNSVVRKALTSGVSVLMLNVTDSHKRSLLHNKIVAVGARGDSAAYMLTPLGGGRRFHITNLRQQIGVNTREISHTQDADGVIIGTHKEGLLNLDPPGQTMDQFMGHVHERLAEQSRAVPAPQPPSDYPASSWFQYLISENWTTQQNPAINGQVLSHDSTYSFYGYYDNGSTLGTNAFQWVVMEYDGTVTSSPLTSNNDTDRGYGNTLFQLFVDPNDASGNGLDLALVDAQPTAANNSLSSSLEFNIGYRGSGGNTAWLWQQSLNQQPGNFNGWEGTVTGNGTDINAATMQLEQTIPCDGDGLNIDPAYYKVFVGAHIHPLSAPSSGALNVLGQVLWRTQIVSSDIVEIDLTPHTRMMRLTVSNYFFTWKPHLYAVDFGLQYKVDMDMSQLQPPGGN